MSVCFGENPRAIHEFELGSSTTDFPILEAGVTPEKCGVTPWIFWGNPEEISGYPRGKVGVTPWKSWGIWRILLSWKALAIAIQATDPEALASGRGAYNERLPFLP